ncbi:MAG: acyl-CoA desaturase [Deltaproteobacteria bacterium]|nr:acyl-CoA desaturase [Deltaproteobacteria bacterium]
MQNPETSSRENPARKFSTRAKKKPRPSPGKSLATIPVQAPTANSVSHLTREQIDAIGRELDALRARVVADLGDRDARHIRGVVSVARSAAIAGRTLLMFGFTPVSFGLGVIALSTAKILENMEIGHNVMHGQYDWMNDPTLDSRTYEWDNVCDASQWRHYHNYEHHTFTNVLGKDRDVGYGLIRVSEQQYWHPRHLFQPFSNVLLALLFQWGVGVHDMDPVRHLAGGGDAEEFGRKWKQFKSKAARQLFKDYVLFPLLAPWNAPRVFLGNLAANTVRNVWTNVVIFCGHFPDGTRVFTEQEVAGETRGDWYLRQMLGSANIEGGSWFHVMTGHLSHQIEHHLFPDIPAHRYPEIAVRVKALCETYAIPYNTGSFWQQYGSVLGRIVRLALPSQEPPPAAKMA